MRISIKENDWVGLRQQLQTLANVNLGPDSSPTFAGLTLKGSITLDGLTASTPVYADSDKELQSITVGSSLSFSAPTLNTIQGIRTTDSPTFAAITMSQADAPLNQLVVENSSSTSARYPGFAIYNYGSTGHPYCGFYNAQGTKAAPTLALASGGLGAFVWGGHDGTAFRETARIQAVTEANWGASNRDTRLMFYTATGTGSITEKMRLSANGNFGIGKTASTEKLEVSGKIRADTAFNLNGTDGISDSAVGVPTALTVAGGIVTAITKNDWLDQSVKQAATPTFARLTLSLSSDTISGVTANSVTLTTTQTVDQTWAIGTRFNALNNGSGNITNNLTAMLCVGGHNSSATGRTTLARAGSFQIQNTSISNITTARVLDVNVPFFTSTGIVGTLYGLYIGAQAHANVTTPYAIYQAGSTDRVYLNGNVGVGVDPAVEKLHVNGKIRADTAFNVNGTDGITVTDTVVTALQYSGTTLQYKSKTITFTGGIRTATGAESDWTDVPTAV